MWTLAGVLEELLADGIEEAVVLADNIYLTSLGKRRDKGLPSVGT